MSHRKFLVGLAGNIAAGKSFVANEIVHTLGAVSVQFADPLYEILNKFDPAIFQGMSQEAKLEPFLARPEWTRRHALQYFGTEIIRHQMNDNAWIDCFERTVLAHQVVGASVVCADVRFPNEIEVIKKLGGIVIWLSRPGHEKVTDHVSGNAITAMDCDAVIDNSGDVVVTQKAIFSAWNAHVISSN